MIDYEKLLSFCLKQGMNNEEVFLLHSLFKVSNQEVNLIPKIKQYYSVNKDRGMKFIDIAEGLQERGLLTILKKNADGGIEFKNLQITEEFKNLLFVTDKEYYWNLFRERYPYDGYMNGEHFYSNRPDPHKDFDLFKKHMLKNKNKSEADKMIQIIESMFDWNCVKKKADGYASVGISKFIYNWETILKEWQEESSSPSSNYKSL